MLYIIDIDRCCKPSAIAPQQSTSMDDKQLLAVLERQRYRATALDISLKTGATVEDSEEALAQLLAACGGSPPRLLAASAHAPLPCAPRAASMRR